MLSYVACCAILPAAFEAFFSRPGNTNPLVINFFNDNTGFSQSKHQVILDWGRYYYLPDLTELSAAVKSDFGNRLIGIKWYSMGRPEYYYETVLELGLAFSPRPGAQIYSSLGFYNLSIGSYGQSTPYAISFGGRFQLENHLFWSTYLFNSLVYERGDHNPELPKVIYTGVDYSVGDNLFGLTGWQQDLYYPGRLHFGVNWAIFPWFSCMAGYYSAPAQLTAGFKLQFSRLSINYAAYTHQQLDLSQAVSLGFSISR